MLSQHHYLRWVWISDYYRISLNKFMILSINKKIVNEFFSIEEIIERILLVSNRISRLYPKFSESTSTGTSSTNIGLNELIQAANICLEKRLTSHSISDENFAKLKLALEQIHTTIERTEQVHKTLDHLEHLPKHIQRYNHESVDLKTPFDHIATKFYSSIDCGQQAREIFREQMSKQTPNSFVTCCNTIATISADDSNSDLNNDDTTIIRCQIPTKKSIQTDEGMLKGLECLLLNEQPQSIPIQTIDDDESFLNLEQQCQMESEIFLDRDTILETNNVASVMLEEKMEDDYPDKENLTPIQQQINQIHIDKLENDIQFISPIVSVPIGQ